MCAARAGGEAFSSFSKILIKFYRGRDDAKNSFNILDTDEVKTLRARQFLVTVPLQAIRNNFTMSLRPILRPTNPPSIFQPISTTYICSQCRFARLIRRPKRPYTFTQLVTLSDGSAFTIRTTSPLPVYRSTRDTRNSPLWNPSSKALANVEADEAGRLAAFRARFGRGFDASKELDREAQSQSGPSRDRKEAERQTSTQTGLEDDDYNEEDESLLDLISGFGQEEAAKKDGTPMAKKTKTKTK